MSWLSPDYMFRTYSDITPEFLHSIGIRALLMDIDNTLAPYEHPDPDERNIRWLSAMQEAGIGLAFISNNDRERVERFNKDLGLPAYWKSGKPFRRSLDDAMTKLNVTARETAMLGDQLLTDALAGKHIGLRAIIVPPIKDKTSAFFRFKRWCEKPFIRKFKKKNNISW
jgi:HAD superfamily phosphatase (TIGR01668 family)